MATDAQIAAYRAAGIELTGQVEADLAQFWSYLDLARPDRVRTALLNYVPLLVQRYGDIAATVAADWFESLYYDALDEGLVRRVATSTARSFVATTAPPDLAVVESGLLYATDRYLTSPTPEKVLDVVSKAAAREVLQTGRRTIVQNTRQRGSGAAGWGRRARPGACRFCRALASRGAVYKEATARFASHAPVCNCVAFPVFDHDAPEVDVSTYVASRNTARMNPRERERHRAQVAAWLEHKYPGESDHAPGEHAD